MVSSSDTVQRALDRRASEPASQPHGTSPPETFSMPYFGESSGDKRIEPDTLTTNADSDRQPTVEMVSGVPKSAITLEGTSDAPTTPVIPTDSSATPDLSTAPQAVVQLQHALADLKTANKAKEVLLRSTRAELKNARDTLAKTFAEYCGIRDEMKMMKHNITKEHQAVVYRKDIELFALRKGNEQKEKYIREHESKLEEVYRQQQQTVELKDAQVKMLKEKLASLGRQMSPRLTQDFTQEFTQEITQEFKQELKQERDDGKEALEVRVLKVKKGKRSASMESLNREDKDATIARLRGELSTAQRVADGQKSELQRVWDIAKNRQAAIKMERELHAHTKETLQEMTAKLAEHGPQTSQTRLPTIAENNDELEAMYDATQQDNCRLNAENTALEKRLRDSNTRLFQSARNIESLRTQLAQASNLQPGEALQQLEAQLTSARCALTVKEHQLGFLKQALSEKMDRMDEAKEQLDAAVRFHTHDQDEIERLKGVVRELRRANREAERERLTLQLTKSLSKSERPGGESGSAMSTFKSDQPSGESDAAEHSIPKHLVPPRTKSTPKPRFPMAPPPPPTAHSSPPPTDNAVPQTITALPPIPLDRQSSIQLTPTHLVRPDMHLLQNDVPPAEMRAVKRRSWDLRGRGSALVKKIARPALSVKDKNAPVRPCTAGPSPKHVQSPDEPFITSALAPAPAPARPVERSIPRYYAIPGPAQPQNWHEYRPAVEERPRTAKVKGKRASWGIGIGSKKDGEGGDEGEGSKEVKGKETPRKLKRRSMY